MSTELAHPLRIIVVEDEFIIALALEDMLEQLGHEVVGSAGTVSKALILISQTQPDIVLLDVNLNSERSTPVAEALLERGIAFGLTTAYDAAQLPEDILRSSPSAQKPVSLEALRNLLDELC